jgi:hypothetical protein
LEECIIIPEQTNGEFRIKYKDGICQLFEGNKRWMCNSSKEISFHENIAKRCMGKVLIGGLGTGLIIEQLNNNNDVTEITVVEKNQEVIDLVWKHVDTSKSTIRCNTIENVLSKMSPGEYDTMYLDIWLNSFNQIYTPLVNEAKKKCNNVLHWEEPL